jgi:hypothetical protein
MRCSTLLVPAVVLLAACGDGPAGGGERYTVELERNVSGDVDAVLCAQRPAAIR